MTAYALVLARSGSKGLPHKNIREIAGHPLLTYSIAFAKKIPVDRIIVSTDSPEYREIALRYGAECPYLRGAKASSDTALDDEILADLTENLPRLGIPLPAIWVRLKPTCPPRTVASVEAAIAALRKDDTFDSVRIISESDARVCFINGEGYLEPLLSAWLHNQSVISRTVLPRVFRPFNLDVYRHAGWVERGPAFMGRRIKPIIEHKITGLDIDDADDFDLLSALISIRPRSKFLERFVHDPG